MNAPSATTGISLFYANKGYHPNFTLQCPSLMQPHFLLCKKLVVNLDELHQELKAIIPDAQCHYQGPADA